MSDMTAFNSEAKCPKCGGEDIASMWTAAKEHWCAGVHHCEEQREHIHRTCKRCWYRWNEAPLSLSESRR